MNVEMLLFWGIVLLFVIGGIRMRFIAAFCLAVSNMFALYLGFWQIPIYATWGNLIPKEYSEYINPCLLAILFFVSLFYLRLIFKHVNAIYEKKVEDINREKSFFPKWIQRIGKTICNALSGITMASLLFLLIAVLPLTETMPWISANKMASNGVGGVRFISAVVDLLTLQPWRLEKKSECIHFYLNSEEEDAEEALKKMDK